MDVLTVAGLRAHSTIEHHHRIDLLAQHFVAPGEHEKSLKDCEEVFKRNPNHFGALAGAGQIHLQLGNMRSALEFFRRAVKVNPNLEGPAQMIPLLDRHLQDDDKNRT